MTQRHRILVVDDEPLIRETLAEFLTGEGYRTSVSASGEDTIARIERERFDVVLCDVNLPGMDGVETLDGILSRDPECFVLLITAYAKLDNAIEAFQRGAQDYLMKPINLAEVLRKIDRLLQMRSLARENQGLRRELNRDASAASVSVGMRRVEEQASKVALTRSTVLIVGESGAGKEVLARRIHRLSNSTGPFTVVACAIAPGEFPDEGTVFLDEVAEMPFDLQAKLLHALNREEGPRFLAATNKDLAGEVRAGRFREDLLYRLNVVTLRLPALRERKEDIPALAEALAGKHARAMGKRTTGIRHDAMAELLRCRWKGNVRELDNALQRAVIFAEGPLITPADLPPDLLPDTPDPIAGDDLNVAVSRFERLHIERILRDSADKREAAKRLNIGLSSLYRKIETLGIE